MTLVELKHVSLELKQSGNRHNRILSDISLQLEARESVALVGPSGSGKTSLLMLVAGLETPTAGDVLVGGQAVNMLDESGRARLRRDKMGIVFQSFHLLKSMTALENVMLPVELAGNPEPAREAARMLDSVGLGDRLSHHPYQLSGGEQQRVALARAMVARPQILLADEPTGNLDSANGQLVLDLMFRLCQQNNSALLLITHDRELSQRCGRILTLIDGSLSDDAGSS